jgi:hypothetical protein
MHELLPMEVVAVIDTFFHDNLKSTWFKLQTQYKVNEKSFLSVNISRIV